MKNLVTCLLVTVLSGTAFATTWTVDNDGKADFNNIQDAVDAASDGDEIIVMPGTYTYSGSQLIETMVVSIMDKQLWIHSSEGPEVTIIDGENSSRGIFISFFGGTNNTLIEGFTITRGYTNNSGGGIVCQTDVHAEIAPTITNCIFEYNNAASGGALHFVESDATLINCTISNNAAQLGGGISAMSSHVDVTECTITENSATNFGGGLLETGGQFILRYSMLCGNSPDQFWGDIVDLGNNIIQDECPIALLVPQEYATIQAAVDAASDFDEIVVSPGTYTSNSNQVVDFSYKTLTIRSTDGPEVTIIDGQGSRRGVLYLGGTGVMDGFTISNCYVEGEESDGAGLWARGHITIRNCNFVTNTASGTSTMGGGIFLETATASLLDCVFDDNHSGYWGGGVAAQYFPPVVTNCTFTNNSSKYGGGISVNQSWGLEDRQLLLSGCDFSGNSAYHGGGLSQTIDSGSILTDCNFTENTAIFSGGGINTSSSQSIVLINCSLVDNTVTQGDYTGGGAIYTGFTDFLELNNCTMSGNESPNADGIFAYYTSVVIFGTNTSDELLFDTTNVGLGLGEHSFSSLYFTTDSFCDVFGDVTPSPFATTNFELDDLSTDNILDVFGAFYRQGGLGISNDSNSLLYANVGDIISIAQATNLQGEFASVVLPPMPEGLGLQLIEHTPLRGDGTEMAVEVIEVDGAQFANPFSEDLDNPPVDIKSFDADGDGADEIAVLFDGTPGGVAVFAISEDASPTLIDGFMATVGNTPSDLDARDLDGDGLEDLLVANFGSDTMSVLVTTLGGDKSLTFTVSTISTGGPATSVAVIDWDGDTDLDAVVGIDIASPDPEDGYRVLLDVAGSNSGGPWFSIPKFQIPDNSYVSDPPTCVDGGNQNSSWGFVGGTQYGRVHRVTPNDSLQVITELFGTTNEIRAIDLDANGGDGQLDLMVSSSNTETIYLFQGNDAEPDGFEDLIPLAVSEPVQDILAIDADGDDDMDIMITAPSSSIPLVLLRNDGNGAGLTGSLLGITWSKQAVNSGNPPTKITSGDLNGKDEDDDWVVGVGDVIGFNGNSVGVMEQSNILYSSGCDPDINGDGYVNVSDLLVVIDQWGLANSPADVNFDGIVDVADLLIVVGNWGPCE